MKTVLTYYNFDLKEDHEKAEYDALCARMKAAKIECFETWGNGSHYNSTAPKTIEIELETKHIFNNQWNTAPIAGLSESGLRVHDWAMDARPAVGSSNIKRGHYLEVTQEMRDIRKNTVACGYCGHQQHKEGAPVFCNQCLGSEYLNSDELYLLRLQPVAKDRNRKKLTAEETAELWPLYRHAQTYGNTEREKKRVADTIKEVREKARRTIENAQAEEQGFLWLIERGIKTNNVIYYSHTGKFGFGWRNPIDAAFKNELLDIISEFPFPYEMKCADGKTLEAV